MGSTFNSGKIIREQRKVLGITQLELVSEMTSKGIKMNQTRLSRIEACSVIPKPIELLTIISLLGISKDYVRKECAVADRIITYSENKNS